MNYIKKTELSVLQNQVLREKMSKLFIAAEKLTGITAHHPKVVPFCSGRDSASQMILIRTDHLNNRLSFHATNAQNHEDKENERVKNEFVCHSARALFASDFALISHVHLTAERSVVDVRRFGW